MRKVLLKKVDEEPTLIDIDDELSTLQRLVGGYIEIPYISEELHKRHIDIIINDEGKLIGLEPNIAIINKMNRSLLDFLVGDIIFTGFTDEGETVGLTEEQIEYINKTIFNGFMIIMNSTMYYFIEI